MFVWKNILKNLVILATFILSITALYLTITTTQTLHRQMLGQAISVSDDLDKVKDQINDLEGIDKDIIDAVCENNGRLEDIGEKINEPLFSFSKANYSLCR